MAEQAEIIKAAWNRRGDDAILEERNMQKLLSAKDEGYDVILVIEGKETRI